MPITTAICSIPVFAALLAMPVASVIVNHPGAADAYAVLGAMIGSIMALVEARKKDRSIAHTLSVFLGSASMGAFLPGIAYQMGIWRGWLSVESLPYITWQAWAAAGVGCGLFGWGVLHLVSRIGARMLDFYVKQRLEKKLGLPPEEE
jgi:predicted membrane protein